MLPWSIRLIALSICLGMLHASPSKEQDELAIRSMVDQAIVRLNRGDVTAFDDFWDEHADYVGVDGRLTKGRSEMQNRFRQMSKGSAGEQAGTIEQIRFVTADLATVDGTWTVIGARDAAGKELPVIKGRGFELVQKKSGRWRFIATREMVIFGGT